MLLHHAPLILDSVATQIAYELFVRQLRLDYLDAL